MITIENLNKIIQKIDNDIATLTIKKEAYQELMDCENKLSQFAFDTKTELDDFVKNNPDATCRGIPTTELVEFITANKGKFLYLKEANLKEANFADADLEGVDLMGAYFKGATFV